jgi:hypothetical protein
MGIPKKHCNRQMFWFMRCALTRQGLGSFGSSISRQAAEFSMLRGTPRDALRKTQVGTQPLVFCNPFIRAAPVFPGPLLSLLFHKPLSAETVSGDVRWLDWQATASR